MSKKPGEFERSVQKLEAFSSTEVVEGAAAKIRNAFDMLGQAVTATLDAAKKSDLSPELALATLINKAVSPQDAAIAAKALRELVKELDYRANR